MNDLLVLEVRRLREAVAEVQDEMAELRRCLLAKADRRTGARLLPALGRVTHGQPFDPVSLATSVLNPNGPSERTVAEIINDYMDADAGFRGLGRLLQRLHGARFGGLALVPAPGGRWRVDGFPAK